MTKYRIIVNSSTVYPFRVQKKDPGWFSFWTEIAMEDTQEQAEFRLKEYIRAKIPPVGTIVKTYDEQDLLADILKGNM